MQQYVYATVTIKLSAIQLPPAVLYYHNITDTFLILSFSCYFPVIKYNKRKLYLLFSG